ncbi:MAG: FAD-binding oxidoreductase [Vicinamibacterales bacterium]
MVTPAFLAALRASLGDTPVLVGADERAAYAHDALGVGPLPDVVVRPAHTADVAAVARLCHEHGVPLIVRGAGTGYTGGAVATRGGVVLAMDRLNRIIEIDDVNLLAVVEPNVITADLQRAVEARGLFYPPDPASLEQSSLGGNVAECAGGPRAFKYGVTRRYVLGLEAVLPTGEIVRTGSKAVKNVVGYDLTQLLIGSEGTLAIVTRITLRLIPRPATAITLLATFATIDAAVDAVTALIRHRLVPAAIELVDGESLRAVARHVGQALVPEGCDAALLLEVDGSAAAAAEDAVSAAAACAEAGALSVDRAATEEERQRLWTVRRQLSPALKGPGIAKVNHDVVVPRGRIPQLFAELDRLRQRHGLRIAAFGHAGDGNIHVNLLVDERDEAAVARAHVAERELFERVVALEGSISGEHGIGFAKAPYLGIELSPDEIALMQRVKQAFDPKGILNPGKIFPEPTPPARS